MPSELFPLRMSTGCSTQRTPACVRLQSEHLGPILQAAVVPYSLDLCNSPVTRLVCVKSYFWYLSSRD